MTAKKLGVDLIIKKKRGRFILQTMPETLFNNRLVQRPKGKQKHFSIGFSTVAFLFLKPATLCEIR